MGLMLSQQPEADALLDRDPLALLIGMVLDQQFPLERAFFAPYGLVQRLGHDLDVRELADYDPDALAAIFAKTPVLHRFPRAMAKRVQELCRLLVDRYDGDAAAVWQTASGGADVLRRVAELPGFGKYKAQIFIGLLGKQYGVRPAGWVEAAGPFGAPGSYLSVADIVDGESLRRVREYKQQLKAAAKAAAGPAASAGRTAAAAPARARGGATAKAPAKAAKRSASAVPKAAVKSAKAPAKAAAKSAKAPAKVVAKAAKAAKSAKAPAKVVAKAGTTAAAKATAGAVKPAAKAPTRAGAKPATRSATKAAPKTTKAAGATKAAKTTAAARATKASAPPAATAVGKTPAAAR
jgi:uncharacterized HhH-GPD family protein